VGNFTSDLKSGLSAREQLAGRGSSTLANVATALGEGYVQATRETAKMQAEAATEAARLQAAASRETAQMQNQTAVAIVSDLGDGQPLCYQWMT